MHPRYDDIEFAKIMKMIPSGYYLVFPLRGTPY